MFRSVIPHIQGDKAVTLQDAQISGDGGAIHADLLGKTGDAFLSSTAEDVLQKHVLRDLQATGSEDSIIYLGERLCRVADRRACANEFRIHDVSIYPYLVCV